MVSIYRVYTYDDGSQLVILTGEANADLGETPAGHILNLETFRYVPESVFAGAVCEEYAERPSLPELVWFSSQFIGII